MLRYVIRNVQKLKYWAGSMGRVRYALNRVLWDSGSPWNLIRPEALEDMFPNIENVDDDVRILYPRKRKRGMSIELEELVTILTIVKYFDFERIVEVGTYDGNTTLNMALNMNDQGRIVTIDLAPDGLESPTLTGRIQPVDFPERQYVGTSVEGKIQQVYGDSAKLDWDGLGGPFDMAFIDGDHSSEYALNDTRKALSVLRPGGTILWHDYEMETVSRVIDEAVILGENINWIKGTRIAIGMFDDPLSSRDKFVLP